MSGTVWIPEAEQLTPAGTSGTMLGGPARVVWHTTEAPSGGNYFNLMHQVLTSKKAEPHILYDPLTDRLGQYFPLNRSARALRNDAASGTSTNKTGTVCIQIEVVGYASKPFTSYWKPGPNFAALMRAIRSWGIPDVWPGGSMSAAGESVSRDLATYITKAGHYGHCHVPGNTHWDCGAIDQQALFRAVTPQSEPEAVQEDTDMRLIQSENRGIAVVGPGYFKGLSPEQLPVAIACWGSPYVGNDRQFDLARAIATQGATASTSAQLADAVAKLSALPGAEVDEAAIAAALAPAVASAVIAAIGTSGGVTVADVEAAVRGVFADAAT